MVAQRMLLPIGVSVLGMALAACGGAQTPAATAGTTPVASATATQPASPAATTAGTGTTALHLSGDRSGDLGDLSVQCDQPAGPGGANEMDVLGTLAGTSYKLRIDPSGSLGWSVSVSQMVNNEPQAAGQWTEASMAGVDHFEMTKGATLDVTLQPGGGAAAKTLTVTGQVVC